MREGEFGKARKSGSSMVAQWEVLQARGSKDSCNAWSRYCIISLKSTRTTIFPLASYAWRQDIVLINSHYILSHQNEEKQRVSDCAMGSVTSKGEQGQVACEGVVLHYLSNPQVHFSSTYTWRQGIVPINSYYILSH